MTTKTTLEHAEWAALMRDRFGANAKDWAFVCPACGDIATGADFVDALTVSPRLHRNTGHAVTAADIMGQECIGRTLGALGHAYAGRGCNWAAYGLFAGPWFITMADGSTVATFAAAPPPDRTVSP